MELRDPRCFPAVADMLSFTHVAAEEMIKKAHGRTAVRGPRYNPRTRARRAQAARQA